MHQITEIKTHSSKSQGQGDASLIVTLGSLHMNLFYREQHLEINNKMYTTGALATQVEAN